MTSPTTIHLQLDRLLDWSVSTHGYWIKNHIEVVESDLREALNTFGYSKTCQLLDDYKSPWCRKLYQKIKAHKA